MKGSWVSLWWLSWSHRWTLLEVRGRIGDISDCALSIHITLDGSQPTPTQGGHRKQRDQPSTCPRRKSNINKAHSCEYRLVWNSSFILFLPSWGLATENSSSWERNDKCRGNLNGMFSSWKGRLGQVEPRLQHQRISTLRLIHSPLYFPSQTNKQKSLGL